MSNSMDPDQDLCSVGLNRGPNCLQMLSACRLQKSPLAKKELTSAIDSDKEI